MSIEQGTHIVAVVLQSSLRYLDVQKRISYPAARIQYYTCMILILGAFCHCFAFFIVRFFLRLVPWVFGSFGFWFVWFFPAVSFLILCVVPWFIVSVVCVVHRCIFFIDCLLSSFSLVHRFRCFHRLRWSSSGSFVIFLVDFLVLLFSSLLLLFFLFLIYENHKSPILRSF